MSTSREWLEKYSREDLIGTIQALEDSLAEAAKGLMTEGSLQEWRRNLLRARFSEEDSRARLGRLPRIIRWWYGC